MNIAKLPPQELELEAIVLGAILIKQDVLLEISELLSEDSFYKDNHKQIYRAIHQLSTAQKTIDLMTVVQQLRKNSKLEEVGGPVYISELTSRIASTANVLDHVKILKQKEISRKQIILGNDIVQRAYNPSKDSIETNEFIADEAFKLNNLVNTNHEHSNTELVGGVAKRVEAAALQQGLTGVATGFKRTDSIIGGYQPSTLVIKAARPAMGKTAHALAEALNASLIHKKKVLFFSLEMGAEELMQRLITIHTQIEGDKFRTGEFNDKDWNVFHSNVGAITKAPLKIIDDVYSLNGIINKTKKEALKTGVDIIFIDYIQLIENNLKNGNREQAVSDISRKLKMLSKDLKIPVVALAQLSRKCEERADKRPMLSDLRESGAIEQDADVVTFLYRPEYYGIMDDGTNSFKGKGYLLIAKHRAGSLMDIEMNWKGATTTFSDDTLEEAVEVYNPNSAMKPKVDDEQPF